MGKGSAQNADTANKAQTDIAKRTLDIGEKLIKESEPARQFAQTSYMGLAKGNRPGIEQFTAPITQQIDRQFAQAEAAALQMPPGGMRDQALRDIQLQKATAKNQAYTGGVQEGLARTAAMGWGGTQAGVGAYGQSAGTYGQVAQSYTDAASAKGGMAGQGAGALGALGAGAIMA